MTQKVVLGVGIASHPVAAGGNSWLFLQWVLGFRDLGWDVWCVEQVRSTSCIDPRWQPCAFADSTNRRHWDGVVRRFELGDCATLFVDDDAPGAAAAQRFAHEADLFVNLSGHFAHPDFPMPRARRAYVDLDPGFTQAWAEVYGADMHLAGHDAFFSVGTRLGETGCRAPTCGIDWQPTFPPVALRHWPFEPQPEFRKFSTVANWGGYGWCEWDGEWYTGKSDEFVKFVDLPRRVPASLEIATDVHGHAGELRSFREAGWQLADTAVVCASLEGYEHYVRESSAEFTAAKGGYVLSQAGWFSDRSVCYLASGRPVVLQETGVGSKVPVGSGLHTFRTPEEAAACCRRVVGDFAAEQRAARALAERYFASDVVIHAMLSRLSGTGERWCPDPLNRARHVGPSGTSG
jgi:hypothetical protein